MALSERRLRLYCQTTQTGIYEGVSRSGLLKREEGSSWMDRLSWSEWMLKGQLSNTNSLPCLLTGHHDSCLSFCHRDLPLNALNVQTVTKINHSSSCFCLVLEHSSGKNNSSIIVVSSSSFPLFSFFLHPPWPFQSGFHCVAQAGLELTDMPASDSWVLQLKVWATTVLQLFSFLTKT